MTRPSAIKPAEFPWADYSGQTFSLGLLVGADAILSGHSGAVYDPAAGKPVIRGGMGAQAQVAYDKQAASLAAAGMSFADVTRVVENVTVAGLNSYAEARQVRERVFGASSPAVITVVVDRLVRRAALIEVELHASAGGGPALSMRPPAATTTSEQPNGSPPLLQRRDTVRGGYDGLVYLPTLLPVDEAGELIAPGNVRDQYAYLLQRAAQLLESVGLSLADLAAISNFGTGAIRDDVELVDPIRAALPGPVYPASSTVLMTQLHAPGILVAMDVVASRHPVTAVDPGWQRARDGTFSPAVRAGSTLFLSGVTSADRAGRPSFASDLRAQAEAAYGDILEILGQVGASPGDLLSTVEYVTPAGIGDYRAVADVRRAMLAPPYPASTGIVCGSLLDPGSMFQVLPTAFIPPADAATSDLGDT